MTFPFGLDFLGHLSPSHAGMPWSLYSIASGTSPVRETLSPAKAVGPIIVWLWPLQVLLNSGSKSFPVGCHSLTGQVKFLFYNLKPSDACLMSYTSCLRMTSAVKTGTFASNKLNQLLTTITLLPSPFFWFCFLFFSHVSKLHKTLRPKALIKALWSFFQPLCRQRAFFSSDLDFWIKVRQFRLSFRAAVVTRQSLATHGHWTFAIESV